MKEFNLERWLRTGEELITRGGVKALYTKYFEDNDDGYKLKSILADGSTISHYKDGLYGKNGMYKKFALFFVNEKEPEAKPKRGDTVWVRSDNVVGWLPRIFLIEIKDIFFPYCTVSIAGESAFREKRKIYTSNWKYMRTTDPALDKPEIKITVKVNGKEVELSTLSDESILAIKNANKQ